MLSGKFDLYKKMKLVPFVIGAYFIIISLIDSIQKLGIEFPVGPFEDTTLQIVKRILDNKPIYSNPDALYVPLLYAPGYFYISALISKITGFSFLSIRLFSVLSLLGMILFNILLFQRISKQKDLFSGIVSAGLFFTAYSTTHYWLSFAKVDALFILNIAAILYFLFLYLDKKNLLSFILLVSASALIPHTKQTGLLFIFSSFAVLFIYTGLWKSFLYILLSMSIYLFSTLFFVIQEGNYFYHYVWYLPSTHLTSTEGVLSEFIVLQGALTLLCSAALILFIASEKFNNKKKILNLVYNDQSVKIFLILALFMFTGLAISIVGRLKIGAMSNSLLYGFYTSSIFCVWVIPVLLDKYLVNRKIFFSVLAVSVLTIGFQVFLGNFNIIDIVKKNDLVKKDSEEYSKILCTMEEPSLSYNYSFLGAYYCGHEENFCYQCVIDIIFDKSSLDTFGKSIEHTISEKKYKYISGKSITYISQTDSIKMMQYLDNEIAKERNEKKKKLLESFKYSYKLNLLINQHYRPVNRENFSNKQKRFVEYTEKLLHSEIFILEAIH